MGLDSLFIDLGESGCGLAGLECLLVLGEGGGGVPPVVPPEELCLLVFR